MENPEIISFENEEKPKKNSISILDLYGEELNYNTLDMLVSGAIPDDCDTLVITTPTKDFDELTTNEITKYINNGVSPLVILSPAT